MQKFIEKIFNPPADGNCGFYAVAKGLSLSSPQKEKSWREVRQDLIEEIDRNHNYYSKILGGEVEMDNPRDNLMATAITQMDNLLSKWEHGPILTNTCKCPFLFFHPDWQNLPPQTFLPNLCTPCGASIMHPISLNQQNGNHWILIIFNEHEIGKLLPPKLQPQWPGAYSHQSASNWRRVYSSSMKLFCKRRQITCI
ncbi:hypothetical protein O181_005959 [Austropuccinia psidii MF-1]|uniref:OTU domain-containing protein n=1 Tax=Austropuccinia psidii MF-1 TaxID=1389203 RepID=A0A9Q3BIG9_9BASI|nr:hypothetical protein [Austropuccinia psidii MF-1]